MPSPVPNIATATYKHLPHWDSTSPAPSCSKHFPCLAFESDLVGHGPRDTVAAFSVRRRHVDREINTSKKLQIDVGPEVLYNGN